MCDDESVFFLIFNWNNKMYKKASINEAKIYIYKLKNVSELLFLELYSYNWIINKYFFYFFLILFAFKLKKKNTIKRLILPKWILIFLLLHNIILLIN